MSRSKGFTALGSAMFLGPASIIARGSPRGGGGTNDDLGISAHETAASKVERADGYQ